MDSSAQSSRFGRWLAYVGHRVVLELGLHWRLVHGQVFQIEPVEEQNEETEEEGAVEKAGDEPVDYEDHLVDFDD